MSNTGPLTKVEPLGLLPAAIDFLDGGGASGGGHKQVRRVERQNVHLRINAVSLFSY